MDTRGFTAEKIAEIIGEIKSIILHRAKNENWTYLPGKSRTKFFVIHFLPEDIKTPIVAYLRKRQALNTATFDHDSQLRSSSCPSKKLEDALWAVRKCVRAETAKSLTAKTRENMCNDLRRIANLLAD